MINWYKADTNFFENTINKGFRVVNLLSGNNNEHKYKTC